MLDVVELIVGRVGRRASRDVPDRYQLAGDPDATVLEANPGAREVLTGEGSLACVQACELDLDGRRIDPLRHRADVDRSRCQRRDRRRIRAVAEDLSRDRQIDRTTIGLRANVVPDPE